MMKAETTTKKMKRTTKKKDPKKKKRSESKTWLRPNSDYKKRNLEAFFRVEARFSCVFSLLPPFFLPVNLAV